MAPAGLNELERMSLYTDGLEMPSSGDTPTYFGYFDVMQFPQFPQEADTYLAEDEYFVLGDNRYNSIDSRLGRSTHIVSLDPLDEGIFSKTVKVSWQGHVIPRKNIQGRVRSILFPFNRMKIFP